jgi:hypothetical protein
MTILLKTIDFFFALGLSIVAAGMICVGTFYILTWMPADDGGSLFENPLWLLGVFGLAFVVTFTSVMRLYWRRLAG